MEKVSQEKNSSEERGHDREILNTKYEEEERKRERLSKTKCKDIPLEVLDVILQNCYMHLLIRNVPAWKDVDIFTFLSTVSFCWFLRIRNTRFKASVLQQLSIYFQYIEKRAAIIRNNRNFFLEYLDQDEKLVDSLVLSDCLTQEQADSIQKLLLSRDKNDELLHQLRPYQTERYKKFIDCLYATNQHRVAKVLENGGVVVNVNAKSIDTVCNFIKLINRVTDTWIITPRRPHRQIVDIDVRMKEDRSLSVWIWLQWNKPFNVLKMMRINLTATEMDYRNDFNEKVDFVLPKDVSIDNEELLKSFGKYQFVLALKTKFVLLETEPIFGVTNFKNKIYILSGKRKSSFTLICVIRSFEARTPFYLEEYFVVPEIGNPWDIITFGNEDCLLISDQNHCVWKMSEEKDGTKLKYKVVKWLGNDGMWTRSLSMCTDGNLLILSQPVEGNFNLKIYRSTKEILLSAEATPETDLQKPIHAVESSKGNFFILHSLEQIQWDIDKYSNEMDETEINFITKLKHRFSIIGDKYAVSEVSRDLKTLYRRFSDRDEEQMLRDPRYLVMDSEDRVIVADADTRNVIVLDSYLQYNQRILPIPEADLIAPWKPWRLHFDRERKQLFVVGLGPKKEIFVYNFFRK